MSITPMLELFRQHHNNKSASNASVDQETPVESLKKIEFTTPLSSIEDKKITNLIKK